MRVLTVLLTAVTGLMLATVPGPPPSASATSPSAAGSFAASSCAAGAGTGVTTVLVPAGADTFVDAATPRRNYGRLTRLSVDGAPSRKVTYLRFNLARYAGQKVHSAHLRVRTAGWSDSGSPHTQAIRLVPSNAWAETKVTFAHRPQLGARLGTLTRTTPNRTYTRPLMAATVQSRIGKKLSLAIAQPSSSRNGIHLASRQVIRPAHRPTLVLRLAAPTPPTTTPPPPAAREAAAIHGWGSPVFRDEFNYTGAPNPALWKVYDSKGHAGNGRRAPSQVTVNGSALQITGLPDGTTGGMSGANVTRGRTYGRWEARMRVNDRDPKYHPVLIVWPDGQRRPENQCMEIDYAESTSNPAVAKFFLHYNCSSGKSSTTRTVDMTKWHNYAVEWTAEHIVGYLDGEVWFTERRPDRIPHWPAHQTIQLDWFPDGTATKRSWMQVDWWRMYDAPGTRTSR